MTVLAIDTEYNQQCVPFMATVADEHLETQVFYPNKDKDWFILNKLCTDPNIQKVFHSATSDIYALSQIGIYVVPPYHCTFILASVLDENIKSKNLKNLAKIILKEPCTEAREMKRIMNKVKRRLKKNFSWDRIPKPVIRPYAVMDAVYTVRLFTEHYQSQIKNIQSLYDMELQLIPVIVKMMQRGVKIDQGFCRHEIEVLTEARKMNYRKIKRIMGKNINLKSCKQLSKFLNATETYFPGTTKKGLRKTDNATLEEYKDQYPVLQWILNCRNCDKQTDTYYNPLLNKYTSDDDSIAHFQFYQSATKTGRFSAELVQTIPKREKNIFIPNNGRKAFVPRSGYVYLFFDYDQIEMRLFIHFTKNQSLIKAVKQGFDPHDKTAEELFEEEYKLKPKEARRDAKDINFGLIFGMGIRALAKKISRSVSEAQKIMGKYNQLYGIKDFIREQTRKLKHYGFVTPEWVDRKYHVPANKEYKGVNVLIQGSAAYIIKLAMLRLAKKLKRCPGVHMVLQVHDELIFEVHKSVLTQELIENIKNQMEDHDTFLVPITVSIEYSDVNWKEKRPWKFVEGIS